MKYLALFFALFLVNKASAQVPEVPKLNENLKLISVTPQAKFLYNTDKGKIFALPLDNMRCLVSDKVYSYNEKRQYRQVFPPDIIPNLYPKMELIPKVPNEKISIYKTVPQITK